MSSSFICPQELNATTNDAAGDTMDEEFRRAQEMALAVTVLGSTCSNGGMTAVDIRQAVADVITERSDHKRSPARKKAAPPARKPKNNESSPLTTFTKPTSSPPPPFPMNLFSDYFELFQGKLLKGQNLLVALGMMNGSLLYLTMVAPDSDSPIFQFFNVAFVVNMTVLACLVKEEPLPAPSTPEPDESAEDQVQPLPVKQPKNMHKLEWLDDIDFLETDLWALERLQPESTLAERRRFLKARKFCVKAASAQLGSYLEWRRDNRIDEFFSTNTFSTDLQDWQSAARGAVEIGNETNQHVISRPLPRLVSIFEDDFVVCKNGARVIFVLPCQVDSSLADLSTYALAVAMYLDRKLRRDQTEKVTVVIDIRFGKGWTNPSSVAIVPFIKLVVGLLNTYFPERLSRCILYPLPRTATMLFNTAKTYLDPDTAAKIQVCSGSGSIESPVPEKVQQFIDRKEVQIMEARRKSFFR